MPKVEDLSARCYSSAMSSIVMKFPYYCLLLLTLWPLPLTAEDSCGKGFRMVPIAEVVATAGTWANARNSEGSVRFESGRLLKSAEVGLAAATPPENCCDGTCVVAKIPQIVLRSTPATFLSEYGDKELCAQYLEKTKVTPLSYGDKVFPSMEALNDWVRDFSQGKGADGEDLYRRCSGACSPQYEYVIEKNHQGLSVDANAICGPARDKSDNQYRLETAYRWTCEPVK